MSTAPGRDDDLHAQALAALLTRAPADKCRAVERLNRRWRRGELALIGAERVRPVDDPGRPARPQLVPQTQLPRRGLGSARGRLALAHALAHIEFNAINLALDAVYRFRGLAAAFYADWLRVAEDEARHFRLLDEHLAGQGCAYGDLAAHGGLWDAARRSSDDVLARMALVPRVLEARGLDVTPALIDGLQRAGDGTLAGLLQTIYRDEIAHVRIGDYWFKRLCRERGEDARAMFRALVTERYAGGLRGPFNAAARSAAGFSEAELGDLEALSRD